MASVLKKVFSSAAAQVLDAESALILNAGILNESLALALQWGNELGQKTRCQLRRAHPDMNDAELTAYDNLSRKAMLHGHRIFYAHTRFEDLSLKDWQAQMQHAYAWIAHDNLGRIYSQGSYFAWREGLSQKGRDALRQWRADRSGPEKSA